jgi:hypothetical protein
MPEVSEVEEWLDRLYIAVEEAELRQEDRRKAQEIAAMLAEVRRAAARFSKRAPLVLTDAAAGKSYLGLLSAKLVFEPQGSPARVITIERDEPRVLSSRRAVSRLGTSIPIECRIGNVEDGAAWPEKIAIVTALHACGSAADAIIDRVIALRARMLLLVPCCTSSAVASTVRAQALAETMGIPRHAPVRRRFIQAMVDTERTWRLEAAGYETEVVEFVAPTVTPHNLLWRARLVQEPRRMELARRKRNLYRG